MEPLNANDAQRYAEFKLWTPYEAALLLAGYKPLPRGHIPEPSGNTPAFNLLQAIQYCGPSKNLETPHPPETWMLWYSEYLAGYDFPEFSKVTLRALEKHLPAPDSNGPSKPLGKKTKETLQFEAKVSDLLTKFWNDRKPGTTPTKDELCALVFHEILRGTVRGKRKTTLSMVKSAAKLWPFPIVLPAFVPDSKYKDKRHSFKGEK